MWEIKFTSFRDENDYFNLVDGLEKDFKAAVYRTLEKFENDILTPKHIKSLSKGLYELKTSNNNNEFRTIFFYQARKIIIVTHGFVKKEQKTPKKEIERAIQKKNSYLKGALNHE